MDILVFAVDSYRYALPASAVEQVVRSVAITALPGAPLVVEGVVNVRGTIVPVLDLRLRFGLPKGSVSLTDLLIVASSGSRRIAVRANGGVSILKIDPAALGRASDSLAQSRYVAGLARLPDGIIIIHDLASFLSEAESESLTKALADNETLGAA